MKDTDDPGGIDANVGMGVPLDPTLISLFSDDLSSSRSAVNGNMRQASFTTNASFAGGPSSKDGLSKVSSAMAAAREAVSQKIAEKRKNISYSTYVQGKTTEVAKRRNLNERVEKMKSSSGIIFNVPQCKEITTNQLAIFLRRLRKSADVRSSISTELMAQVFQEDQPPSSAAASSKAAADFAERKHFLLNGQRNHLFGDSFPIKQSSKHPAVISVNALLGEKDESMPSTSTGSIASHHHHHHHHHYNHQHHAFGAARGSSSSYKTTTAAANVDSAHGDDYDEALTESSSSDAEMDDASLDGRPSSVNGNANESDVSGATAPKRLYFDTKITAENYAFFEKRMQVISADFRAAVYLKRCEELQKRARKIAVPDLFEFEPLPQTGDDSLDSQSCARCRPVLNRPPRHLVVHRHIERRNQPSTFMRSNLYCGVAQYATVDDSIHPTLSLASAIPMERKMQKYLHAISTIAPEIERRRQKTTELAYAKKLKSMRPLFYNTEELQFPEEGNKSPTSAPLVLKKRIPRDSECAENQDPAVVVGSAAPPPTSANAISVNAAASIELKKDSRRSSIHNQVRNDECIYDFDSTFTDIGINNVQHVETKEILIPQFRRKDVLEGKSLTKPCDCCPFFNDVDPFEKIRSLHEVLEREERMRFRTATGSR